MEFTLLRFLGCCPPQLQHLKSKNNLNQKRLVTFVNTISLLIFHFYTLYHVFGFFYFVFGHKWSFLELAHRLLDRVRSSLGLATLDYFFIHQEELRQVIESVYAMASGENGQLYRKNYMKSRRRKRDKMAKFFAIFVIISGFSYEGVYFYTVSYRRSPMELRNLTSEATFGMLQNSDQMPLFLTILQLPYTLLTFLISGSFTLVYLTLCNRIKKWVKDEFSIVKAPPQNFDENVIRKLQASLTKIKLALDKMQNCFGPVLLIWYSDLILNITFQIPVVVVTLELHNFHIESGFLSVFCAISFLILTLTTAGIQYLYCDLVLLTYSRLQLEENPIPNDYSSALFRIINLESLDFNLTGWDCFVIDRGLVLTAFTGIVTFAVIVVQIANSSLL